MPLGDVVEAGFKPLGVSWGPLWVPSWASSGPIAGIFWLCWGLLGAPWELADGLGDPRGAEDSTCWIELPCLGPS
eukprot:1593538-Pyramimonas_sp.AAC.1